ncbi:unnamed protein product [Amoebophrya sp. A25]|nr:unnamed protein product [Amoebophrya sp. A25]|eukprot:GSA25T00015808001.1
MPIEIDTQACLVKGLIGGIGAIPGTCGSHPFDVLKIRMQVRGDPLSQAIQVVYEGRAATAAGPAAPGAGGSSSSSSGAAASSSIATAAKNSGAVGGSKLAQAGFHNFYRGFFAAIEQRMITRGPMFLVSELYTQVVYQNSNLSKTQSTFVGSCGSGFTTGFLAGIAEYRKKLLSQDMVTKEEARWGALFATAKKHGTLPWLGRRFIAAGLCSATYDSFFFGTQSFLATSQGFGPGLSYGCAAVCAVVAAFAFDTTVARMMVVPPETPCLPFLTTLRHIFQPPPGQEAPQVGGALGRIARGYRGLSARSVEFFINYSITGMTSVYVVMAFNAVTGKKAQ